MMNTARLKIRKAVLDDADFIFELLNTDSWLSYIGDRGIKTMADAEGYIRENLIENYNRLGHGLFIVTLKGTTRAIGLCGLLQRDFLNNPDLGFAILPSHEGKGYTKEASLAVLQHARIKLGLQKVAAITSEENNRSQHLLNRLGFQLDPSVTEDNNGQTFLHYILEL